MKLSPLERSIATVNATILLIVWVVLILAGIGMYRILCWVFS